MKAILELKKERDEGSIFYRYNIDGTLVWFEQYQDSGHIYMVTIGLGDEVEEDFGFYVCDGSQNDHYYPEYIEICTIHKRLTVDQVDEYVNELLYIQKIAKAIMEIFELDEHKKLYEHFHKED